MCTFFLELPSLLKRSDDLQRLLHFNILQSQQTDSSGALADTLLICNGGTIRTHSFLLQGASPFIWSAIMSQVCIFVVLIFMVVIGTMLPQIVKLKLVICFLFAG